MRYLITVSVPSDVGVETAAIIDQVIASLQSLPQDYEATVEEITITE